MVLQKLLNSKKPFSVCFSQSSFGFTDSFVIMKRCDVPNLYGTLVEESEYDRSLVTVDLTDKEIAYFRKNIGLFNKVLHTQEGRVYELIGTGFKEHYNIERIKR